MISGMQTIIYREVGRGAPLFPLDMRDPPSLHGNMEGGQFGIPCALVVFCHLPLGCSTENYSSIETAYHPTSGQTTSLTGGCNPRNIIGQQGIMVPNMVEHGNQNRKMQSLTR